MRLINICFLSLMSLYLMTSCVNELDNYDAPDGGVYGTIVDAETNQPVPLPVQGSTGVIIKLMEQGTGQLKQWISMRNKMVALLIPVYLIAIT